MQVCRFGLMTIDLHAAVWSGTTQSFMQEPVSKHPKTVCNSSDSSILRSDECRLLFLAQAENHTRFPICPWMPFGETALEDIDLDVRFHTGCDGDHALKYRGWKWVCKHGAVVDSDSSTAVPPCLEPPSQSNGMVHLSRIRLSASRPSTWKRNQHQKMQREVSSAGYGLKDIPRPKEIYMSTHGLKLKTPRTRKSQLISVKIVNYHRLQHQ